MKNAPHLYERHLIVEDVVVVKFVKWSPRVIETFHCFRNFFQLIILKAIFQTNRKELWQLK